MNLPLYITVHHGSRAKQTMKERGETKNKIKGIKKKEKKKELSHETIMKHSSKNKNAIVFTATLFESPQCANR